MHSRPQQIEHAQAVRPYHADWELPPNEVRIGKIVWSANYCTWCPPWCNSRFVDILCYTMLHILLACTCVHARSGMFVDLVHKTFGSIWEPAYCDDLWWVSDGFRLDPARLQRCIRMIYYCHLLPIALDCLTFPPRHDANYHSMPLHWPGCGQDPWALWHWLALVWCFPSLLLLSPLLTFIKWAPPGGRFPGSLYKDPSFSKKTWFSKVGARVP